MLNGDDNELVVNIYLPQVKKEDRVVWSYDKTGEYTVKNGYWLAFNESINHDSAPAIPHGGAI